MWGEPFSSPGGLCEIAQFRRVGEIFRGCLHVLYGSSGLRVIETEVEEAINQPPKLIEFPLRNDRFGG
jgi:hypothetical protein